MPHLLTSSTSKRSSRVVRPTSKKLEQTMDEMEEQMTERKGGGWGDCRRLQLARPDVGRRRCMKGAIQGTEQGSDHRMIETVFDISVTASKQDKGLLFTNASKKDINNRIVDTVKDKLMRNRVQQKMNKLMLTVSEVACKPRSTGMVELSRSWTPTLLGYVDQWSRATGEGYKR
ncbi:hypothetical protein FOC1_g10000709 [Fusarium oxysporum f. sp. cubense race 1]|uniref:Endonuclease/exonuclease/phosphatase domain-containing protein n=1 Tax=Fusarium oxysporum f. sp. cubense (strain race 1) TaxID=1229664 RepID=N4U5Z1_FUSC1|nr:hypothetical protein FOC1_g10000709 [Fusarium oxysporum f. sp. cubense race 1]